MATDTILRAGELKDVLLREIEAADLGAAEAGDVGTVLEVRDGVARIYGLPKALAGEIQNFTGVSDPYEEPLNAEVVVETDKETEAESLAKIFVKLKALGYLASTGGDGYTKEEEKAVEDRLRALGYL